MTGASRSANRDVDLVAVLFAVSGVLHFARPQVFEAIVPRRLPHPRRLVHLSGAVELSCAIGLVFPASRRLAGLVSTGLLIAVFPANVQQCLIAFDRSGPVVRAATVGRLPLQLPLIRTAWRAGRG